MAIAVGSQVKTNATHDANCGVHLASWVKNTVYTVIKINPKNGLYAIGLKGVVTCWVKEDSLTVVGSSKKTSPTKVVAPAKTDPTDAYINTLTKKYDSLLYDNDSGFVIPGTINDATGGKVIYLDTRNDVNKIVTEMDTKTLANQIKVRDPDTIAKLSNYIAMYQNNYGFPPVIYSNGEATTKQNYELNYYDTSPLSGAANKGNTVGIPDMVRFRDIALRSVNANIGDPTTYYNQEIEFYNKYKNNDISRRLPKTFAHVFFTRPDCNIIGTSNKVTLNTYTKNISEFYYAQAHCPDLLKQLTQGHYDHEYMLYLSNEARSFEISDESVETETYGKGLTGYEVPYGKHNVASRTAGKFSIRYIDDKNLHIYTLHKLWIDYITHVYRGKIWPKTTYILNKVLDYPVCVYYILCAEDGETILFWTKYWGVFPLDAPSSALSYNLENIGGVKDPDYTIQYQYAWKEDFNPLSLVELNTHADPTGAPKGGYEYISTYQKDRLGTGLSFTGVPFIETVNTANEPYTFKLRFRSR